MADSYKTVIDVSKYNTITNWANVAKNVDGVIIRCGYRGYGSSGTLTKDSKFTTYIKAAAEAGIPLTVYFFTQAKTAAEGKAEADYVIELIGDYKMSMPIYIDSEYANSSHNGRADSLSKSARTAAVVGFCEEIVAKGYTAGVYASDSWFKDCLDLSKLTDYSLWVARYSSTKPKYVDEYDGWQYTSTGSISGITGNVDISKWYGEISESAATVDESADESKSDNTSNNATSTTSAFATGDKITLKNTSLYGTATSTKVANTKSGTYYVWSGTVMNGRIRITNSSSNVGKAGQITGWVNTNDVTAATTTTTTTSSSTKTTTTTTSSYTAGTKITLKSAKIYTSSTATAASGTKTGTYYLWDGTVTNGRIRITTTKSYAGQSGKITGWVDVSSFSTTTSSSSSSTTSSKTTYTAGTKVTLKKVNLYASATATKASGTKTGTYYLWDGTVTNSRIRITNTKANVGKSGQITGWIPTSAI